VYATKLTVVRLDIDDIEKLKPGYLESTMVWFRDYKHPTVNKFAFEGKTKPKVSTCPFLRRMMFLTLSFYQAYALQILEENHKFWKDLIEGKTAAKGAKYEINLTKKH